jgi:hypothetical protein
MQSENLSSEPRKMPDGRQTRIDFFRTGKTESHVLSTRKSSFEWWHTLTGWLKSSGHEQEHQLEEFRQYLEKQKYSPKTCESYLFMMRKFFKYLDEKEVEDLSFGDIEDYNYDFFVSGKYSRSYQLQFMNSLSLYLEFSQGIKVNLKGLRRSSAIR